MTRSIKCRICLDREPDYEVDNIVCHACRWDMCIAGTSYIEFHDSVQTMYKNINEAITDLNNLLITTKGRRSKKQELPYKKKWLEINDYSNKNGQEAIRDLRRALYAIGEIQKHLTEPGRLSQYIIEAIEFERSNPDIPAEQAWD